MANPLFQNLPPDTWTKVVTNKTDGNLWIINEAVSYFVTYRETGDTAPLDTEDKEVALRTGRQPILGSLGAIDVYVMPVVKQGRIAIALPG